MPIILIHYFYRHLIFSLILLLIISTGIYLTSCSQYVTSPHIKGIENSYLSGQYAKALDEARKRTIDSKDKDRLLFLMESGSILHTMKEWEKSNLALKQADEIAETMKKSVSKQILSFVVNDNKANYRPESFERVLIKLYIALNYLMLDQPKQALQYFKRLNFDLQDIRDLEARYRINYAARYLYAIVAESLNNYNEARVQYNNMILFNRHKNQAEASLYYLGLLENDGEASEKYQEQSDELTILDRDMNPVTAKNLSLTQTDSSDLNYGSLVVIHESGMAPVKKSRGKIGEDKTFQAFLKAGILTAMATKGNTALNFSLILATMNNAQNPIPKYIKRPNIVNAILNVKINKHRGFPTEIYDDYTKMTFENYNDRYPDYVKKNVASLALKVITVMIASHAVDSKNESQGLFGALTSLLGGSIMASTIAPDLRAWNLTYDNLQIKRILLEPGTYQLNIDHPRVNQFSKYPNQFTINSGKPTFIIIRSY